MALFDRSPAKVGGQSRGGVPIFHIRRLKGIVRRQRIRIAMVAVPAEAAQQVVNQAAAAGVEAILNFAPAALVAPPGVKLRNVDLTVSLEGLAYHLKRHDANQK